MEKFTLSPKVDASREFMEIAMDFANPLDLVREGISNAFDAGAKKIRLIFEVIDDCGESKLRIEITDDGHGMDMAGLQSFFDLGNSLRRGDKDTIGEKGHGTKVYFNSAQIEVVTVKSGIKYRAVMAEPNRTLHARKIPSVEVESTPTDEPSGTKIFITGYNHNRRDRFTHVLLKDYILWFTKFGAIEREFNIDKNHDVTLELKGVDEDTTEILHFGHVFPGESASAKKLLDKYNINAPKHYCKRFVKIGNLRNNPEIKYQAVFYVEGLKVRYDYNPMIRRRGYSAPTGAYTVQERYGLWLCKDFMPIQRKNEWINSKGNEYTKFHAFINCQGLRLTANRGSVENTPSEIMQDLQEVARNIFVEITSGDDWDELNSLEDEADAFRTAEREAADFKRRIDKINRMQVAEYKNLHLVEPRQEIGVFSLFMQLSNHDPNIFPFTVVDYDTHVGIDAIAKASDSTPISKSKLYYVEFKNHLTQNFSHAFKNLHSIVCWDIDTAELCHNEEITDIAKEKRTLKIIPPAEDTSDYTHHFLVGADGSHKIEVFVLKTFLKEKLSIEFKPRTSKSIY